MIRKNEGITLIALVVTIIILLILAGVTLSLISGENGILKRATNAVEVDNIERAKEEVSLEIAKYQAQYYEEKYVNGQIEDNLKVGEWIYNLCKEQQIKTENYIFTITLPITGEISEENPYRVTIKKNNKLSSEVTGTLSVEGKLNWDNFDGNIENEGNINQSNANYMILNGGTYLDTGIQEEQLIQNNEEFTIATSVYINKNMQSKIKNMSILGNHYDVNGITWQFEQNSENLLFVVKKSSLLSVDYTPYYEKWTDIVMTYKQGSIKVYFDGELKTSVDNLTFTPYNKLYIGTGYLGEDRTMKGAIKSVKIWNKELSQEEASKINYGEKNTNIQKDFILKEINFNEEQEVSSMISGTNYELVPITHGIGYHVKLSGGNYLKTDLSESEMLENSEFTIAARVKINSNEQKTINYMGILGNHDSWSGFAWQFDGVSNDLCVVYGSWGANQYIRIDYTPYYQKYIDIIATYQTDKTLSVYIDNELIEKRQNVEVKPKGNLCIGSSYDVDTTRGIYGELPYVKIWKKALTKEQIQTLKMDTNTNIETQSLARELDLTKFDNFSNYGTLATDKYQLIMVGRK